MWLGPVGGGGSVGGGGGGRVGGGGIHIGSGLHGHPKKFPIHTTSPWELNPPLQPLMPQLCTGPHVDYNYR